MRIVPLSALVLGSVLVGACARGDGRPPTDATAQRGETVGDLVTRQPAAARVLRHHGIDYCCGGQRPLEVAAREKGVDVAALLAEIDRAATHPAEGEETTRWDERSAVELADHIVRRYHAPLREQWPHVLDLARTVDRAHAARPERPAGLTAHLEAMAASMLAHLDAEERVVWPRIRAGTARADDPEVRELLAEHAELGEALHAMRRMTNGFTPPEDACPTWRALYAELERLEADTEMHVHLENNVLLPRL